MGKKKLQISELKIKSNIVALDERIQEKLRAGLGATCDGTVTVRKQRTLGGQTLGDFTMPTRC